VIYRITNAVLSTIPGTNVVTTGLDHASVRSAIAQFAEKYGKEERIAEPSRETGSVSMPLGKIRFLRPCLNSSAYKALSDYPHVIIIRPRR